jgi:hypothetical protein
LAARQQPGSVRIASSTATDPPVGVPSRSVEDGADYSKYAVMKAGKSHESFEVNVGCGGEEVGRCAICDRLQCVAQVAPHVLGVQGRSASTS